jgi:RsiW-degrading membrane proteinase PrsW (M82 family)
MHNAFIIGAFIIGAVVLLISVVCIYVTLRELDRADDNSEG